MFKIKRFAKKKTLAGQRGFSLIELLMTALVVGIVIPAILYVFIVCIFLNESSRNTNVAMGHAQFVLEDIRSQNTTTMLAAISNGTWNWSAATINTQGLSAMNTESISTTAEGTGLVNVTVTVTWQDGGMRPRTAIAATRVSVL